MSDKIFIVDFDDSFTYNIASVLYPYEKKLKVISHTDFFPSVINTVFQSKNHCAVILGPGPGHPSDFQNYFTSIQKLRDSKNIYVMGICLGHQILGLIDGLVIQDAVVKLHGQTMLIEWENEQRIVQKYNSLSVYDGSKELDIRKSLNEISYQFHPESIGTEGSELFFRELLEFTRRD